MAVWPKATPPHTRRATPGREPPRRPAAARPRLGRPVPPRSPLLRARPWRPHATVRCTPRAEPAAARPSRLESGVTAAPPDAAPGWTAPAGYPRPRARACSPAPPSRLPPHARRPRRVAPRRLRAHSPPRTRGCVPRAGQPRAAAVQQSGQPRSARPPPPPPPLPWRPHPATATAQPARRRLSDAHEAARAGALRSRVRLPAGRIGGGLRPRKASPHGVDAALEPPRHRMSQPPRRPAPHRPPPQHDSRRLSRRTPASDGI
eukprot:scaffold7805_cov116-Isochrysis_galbana.AAC.5